jgi:formate hydrogenlyase subunit 6/NADH:ubiquinone oxidoreductase subunit I
MVFQNNSLGDETENNNLIKETELKPLPELYKQKENCCGCTACYAICPVQAIVMELDEEGFLYPVINSEKCIRCYKCLSVCVFKIDQAAKGYYK